MTRLEETPMRMTSKSRSILNAMCCAAAVTAQFIAGKALRDALFLTSVSAASLPMMLVTTSVVSIVLVGASARFSERLRPSVFVPGLFLANALLFIVEFLLRPHAPQATAVIVYLHVSGVGPLLTSGFWLISSELFDPRTAKKSFGRIGAAGTLGGLAGAVVSERVASLYGVPAMLVVLAVGELFTAWMVRRLAMSSEIWTNPASPALPKESVQTRRSGLATVAEEPHLRSLAALVLLGTTSAALFEFLFKVKAVETFGPGDHLIRFFAAYYAATSGVAFFIQALSSRAALRRFGVGLATSAPSIAMVAGGIAALFAPGFAAIVVARGAEAIFRGSWFRTGYELFYTPVAASAKRSTKLLIDVGVDRLGDAVGGAVIRLIVVFLPAPSAEAILVLAILIACLAVAVASRLNRWYVQTLETSLVARGSELHVSTTQEHSVLAGLTEVRAALSDNARHIRPAMASKGVDPDFADILALRSRDRARVLAVLSREEGPSAILVPHVIPLLAWDSVADFALVALAKVAEERIGLLTDALLDPTQDPAVRRRVARVYAVAVSQRALDGLVVALGDERFDVRFQVARSLAAILASNPGLVINANRIYQVVLEEAAVSRPVWESRRLLDEFVSESPFDEFVRDRAGQSLAHVFTLLALVLPRQPLQIAFRSLNSGDTQLRGTALEYLEQVLPSPIRDALWRFLVPRRPTYTPRQDHGKTIAKLLESSDSLTVRHFVSDLRNSGVAAFPRA
jgi:ATP:ADP antiporter, AAA family